MEPLAVQAASLRPLPGEAETREGPSPGGAPGCTRSLPEGWAARFPWILRGQTGRRVRAVSPQQALPGDLCSGRGGTHSASGEAARRAVFVEAPPHPEVCEGGTGEGHGETLPGPPSPGLSAAWE